MFFTELSKNILRRNLKGRLGFSGGVVGLSRRGTKTSVLVRVKVIGACSDKK